MFTSWSEAETPAELSMASVLIYPPLQRILHAPCVKPRLPPSATTLQRRSAPFTQIASFARSPLQRASAARLDVGADAAVIEQIHGRLRRALISSFM